MTRIPFALDIYEDVQWVTITRGHYKGQTGILLHGGSYGDAVLLSFRGPLKLYQPGSLRPAARSEITRRMEEEK